MSDAITLPPLPKATDFGFRDESGLWNVQDGFTHDQMQAYATAAVEQTPMGYVELPYNSITVEVP